MKKTRKYESPRDARKAERRDARRAKAQRQQFECGNGKLYRGAKA